MITYLQTIVPATGQVAIVFSVGDPPIPYTTAPFDRAAFLAMAPAQRRAAIIAAAKAALPPPPDALPNVGLSPGDQLDIG